MLTREGREEENSGLYNFEGDRKQDNFKINLER